MHKFSALRFDEEKTFENGAGKAGKIWCLHKTSACGKVVNAM
jgi:hypothetical protein